MINRVVYTLCFLVLFCSSITAKETIDSAYHRFNSESLSHDKLRLWLDQFEQEDREAALALLESLHYFTYPQAVEGVKTLHGQVFERLKKDGFIGNEASYERIDFSKIYTAKSGDLISYFYRSANNIKPFYFKNLSDLPADRGERALVLVDDYISTGTQFFYRAYGQENYQLFNEYKKVYLVVLVANKFALEKLKKIKNRDPSVAQDFASTLKAHDEKAKKDIATILNRIDPDKIEIIYLVEEEPLVESIKDAKKCEKVIALLTKYKLKDTLQRKFLECLSLEDYGHSLFFYSCPNNLPPILWSSKLLQENGCPWIPLFERMEGNFLYSQSTLP